MYTHEKNYKRSAKPDSTHPYQKNDVSFIKIGPQEAEILHFKDLDFSYNFNEFNILAEIKSTSLVIAAAAAV